MWQDFLAYPKCKMSDNNLTELTKCILFIYCHREPGVYHIGIEITSHLDFY